MAKTGPEKRGRSILSANGHTDISYTEPNDLPVTLLLVLILLLHGPLPALKHL